MRLGDENRMPASLKAHANKRLIDVPAAYLLWLYDQPWAKQKFADICEYIDTNRTALEAEQEEKDGTNDW